MIKFIRIISIKLLLLALSTSVSAELFTYQLKFVQANQVIPVMQPHLKPDSKLTGKESLLIADVSEEDNKKIISMLAQLDKQLAQYLIKLKIVNRKLDDRERTSVKTSIKAEKNNQPRISKYSTANLNKNNQHFQLRLLEGHQGFINTGESFPVHQIVAQHDKFLPKTSYRKVSSGFYVVVRERPNNQVILNISANAQQRKGKSETNFSAATSQIIGNKDEWILLASTDNIETNISTKSQSSRQPRNYSTKSMTKGKKWYYVKVTE